MDDSNLSVKILHLIDSMALGGAQTLLKSIFEFRNSKNEYLFSLRKTDDILHINHPHIFIHKSKSYISPAPIFKILNLIKKEKIQILHCSLLRSQFFGYIIKLLRPKVKLIFHEHGRIYGTEYPNSIRGTIDNFLYRTFIKLSSNKVDCVIAVSQGCGKRLEECSPKLNSKIKVLYNFANIAQIDIDFNDVNKFRKELFNDENVFIIGFAGRLVERKGWKEFVNAGISLNKKYPDLRFVIAGDGVDKEKLFKMIQNSKTFKFLGHFKNMPLFYKSLDCFVIPSHWEPFGLVFLEALSTKMPIVCSDCDSLNELAVNKDNCLTFKNMDANDLEKKIELLYLNKEIQEKLKNIPDRKSVV